MPEPTSQTAHVEPGGAPYEVALSDSVTMTKFSVGPMDNNAYLLTAVDAATGVVSRLLIDAADEPERIKEVAAGDQATPLPTPTIVVTTHRHGDHWQGLAEIAASWKPELVAGRPDVDAIATGAWLEDIQGVWDGDVVALGGETLRVIGLVGHTPGSIALAYVAPGGATHLFTGDSLFPGGPGKTAAPEDFDSLLTDLQTKVFDVYGDSTAVHPGHGDSTTLGAERPQLSGWRERGW